MNCSFNRKQRRFRGFLTRVVFHVSLLRPHCLYQRLKSEKPLRIEMSLTLALCVIGYYGPAPTFSLAFPCAAEHTEGEATKLRGIVTGHIVESQFPGL